MRRLLFWCWVVATCANYLVQRVRSRLLVAGVKVMARLGWYR